MDPHELFDFIFNRLLQHALGSFTQQLFKVGSTLGDSRGLRLEGNYVALIHVCVLFWPSWAGFGHLQNAHTSLFPIHNFRLYLRFQSYSNLIKHKTDSTSNLKPPRTETNNSTHQT